MTKIARSGSRSGSISHRHGSADPNQNVIDPQHWWKLCFYLESKLYKYSTSVFELFFNLYSYLYLWPITLPEERTYFPFLEKVTEQTSSPSCAWRKVAMQRFDTASQILMLPSTDPDTKCFPSLDHLPNRR
jgi:hypothetical protein